MFRSSLSLQAIARPPFRHPWPVSCLARSFRTCDIVAVPVRHGHHAHETRHRPFCQEAFKSAKIQTSVTARDLPQGAVSIEPVSLEKDAPRYPTVVLQARNNMRKFENCVLLTRVGGFYELYFEHAEEYGPLLNLKVAQKKTNAGPVPMAGFPFFQLDRFLKLLVKDLSCYVAIAEEFPNDASSKVKAGGLLHDRKVSRVVTPGTLIDETFMNPYVNNYILAIHMEYSPYSESLELSHSETLPVWRATELSSMLIGLSWLDLSTGQFFTQSIRLEALSSAIARISPSEIVLDEALQIDHVQMVVPLLKEERHLLTYSSSAKTVPVAEWSSMLEVEVAPIVAADFTPEEVVAGSILLQYVKMRLQGSDVKLQPPQRYQATETMGIDKNSMRALEIRETIRDQLFKGSLLHAIRRTVTKSGARLLNEWLSSPSTSFQLINFRLDLVTRMLQEPSLRENTTSLLRRSSDSQRLVQKFSLGRGDPDDLLSLASTIMVTEEVVSTLRRAKAAWDASSDSTDSECLEVMISRIQLQGPSVLASRIREAIDEEGLVQQHRIEDSEAGEMVALAQEIATSDGLPDNNVTTPRGSRKSKPASLKEHYMDSSEVWIMKPAASVTLRKLHKELEQFMGEKSSLSEDLQARLGAASLTLRWTPGLGHICHIKGKDTRILADMLSVSSSRSTRSFHHPEWTELGRKIDQIRIRIRTEEQQVFSRLREQAILNLVELRRNAAVLDELDIACSFATLAQEQGLVRPILNNSHLHKIVGGRHPTVQGGLREQGRNFVTNNCFVGDQEDVWLITGPNMGGKSTFLRQNALITIMAQVGSYVPADYAEIGIVDQIFSRVGSADSLYSDQSTFMVEMLETATILKNATSRSFVIMDEIGRGTTPGDGLAVAFAAMHHLYHVNRCRTLFATHFHALADLSKDMQRVGYYCTDITEDENGGFNYVHKLRKGVNRDSHALKVAKLAGLPKAAIEVAHGILQNLRSV